MGRSIVVGLIAIPTDAAAQDTFEHSARVVNAPAGPTAGDLQELTARMMVPAGGLWQTPVRVAPASRGAALPALYVSLIGLQAYDGYSTQQGLSHGAIESNSFMSAVVSHPASLWAAKGGAAFVSIYMAERLWRQHRRGQAIALMVASNVIMASVAASNASIIRAQR
jgi:Domain of unknown function (DUF5658)